MHLTAVALVAFLYVAGQCALAALSARIRDQIARHDLLVAVQQRRQAYFRRIHKARKTKEAEQNAALPAALR